MKLGFLGSALMQFMEFGPVGTSMRYRAQFSWGHMHGRGFGFNLKYLGKSI
jgi:hypothetical protein